MAVPNRRLLPFPQAAMDADWVASLAEQPPGAVVVAPFPECGSTREHEPIVTRMLQALEHGQPLVNVFSGFFPPDYRLIEVRCRVSPMTRA